VRTLLGGDLEECFDRASRNGDRMVRCEGERIAGHDRAVTGKDGAIRRAGLVTRALVGLPDWNR